MTEPENPRARAQRLWLQMEFQKSFPTPGMVEFRIRLPKMPEDLALTQFAHGAQARYEWVRLAIGTAGITAGECGAVGLQHMLNLFWHHLQQFLGELHCDLCGKPYDQHDDYRAPEAPQPRVMCLLLKAHFVPKAPGEESLS